MPEIETLPDGGMLAGWTHDHSDHASRGDRDLRRRRGGPGARPGDGHRREYRDRRHRAYGRGLLDVTVSYFAEYGAPYDKDCDVGAVIVSPTGRVVGRPFEATQYIHEDMSSLRTELPSDGRVMFAWDGDDLLEKDGYASLHDVGDLLATAAGIRWRQGDGGCETLRGRAAEDVLSGRGGVDVIKGRGGADRLFGGHGRGRIEGRRGDGVLGGGRRADVLRGGKRADRIEGGRGKDVAAGGEGADTSVFGVGDGRLKIAGFEGRGTTLPDAGPWNGALTARQVVNRFAEDRGLNIGKKGVVIVEDVARAASPMDDIAF